MTDNILQLETQKTEAMDEGSVGDVTKAGEAGNDEKKDVEKLTERLNTLKTSSSTCPASGDEFMEDFIEIGGREQSYFDSVIGAIEDTVMGEDFHSMQTEFLEKYWPEFSEEQTESLHSHFEMFKEYSQGISTFIEDKLQSVLENFDMEKFVEQLGGRGDLDGDIFEMLFTLIDYVKFRELLLDYRAMREGKTIDLSQGISVKAIHIDESEDEMR